MPDPASTVSPTPATTSTLNVEGHIRTMVDYWMGHTDFDDAVRRGDLTVEGPPRLVRAIPTWFRRSLFAPVELPAST